MDPVRVQIILDSLGCKESENTHIGPIFISNRAQHFLKVGTRIVDPDRVHWTRIGYVWYVLNLNIKHAATRFKKAAARGQLLGP